MNKIILIVFVFLSVVFCCFGVALICAVFIPDVINAIRISFFGAGITLVYLCSCLANLAVDEYMYREQAINEFL